MRVKLLAISMMLAWLGVCLALPAYKTFAQARPAFSADRELLCRSLDSRETQERLIAHWENTLNQAALDAPQAVILPPPDDAAKRQALEAARRELQRAGLSAADKAIIEVDAELARVPVAAAAPVEVRR